MQRTIFSVFIGVIIIASCYSCKEKPQQAEQPPAPVSEYDQIPAIQNLTKEIGQNADNAGLYFKRAVAYLELGNRQNAIADLQKAVQLDSTRANYYQLLGRLYYDSEEYTRAMNILEQGNRSVPGDTSLMLQLAKYNLMVGDLKTSITLADEVLRKNMFNANAYFLKGMIFKEFGDTAKSISSFQTAVEHDTRYYDAYLQLGFLFSKKKDKLALDYFKNALSIDSSGMEVKIGMAMYYQEIKEYDKALEICRKLVYEFPQDQRAYYSVGYVYYNMDSLAQAKRNFERATQVEPAYADAYFMLGVCAEQGGDYASAKKFYRQTLNLKPKPDLAVLANKGYKRVEQL